MKKIQLVIDNEWGNHGESWKLNGKYPGDIPTGEVASQFTEAQLHHDVTIINTHSTKQIHTYVYITYTYTCTHVHTCTS